MADEMKSPYAPPVFDGVGDDNYLGNPAVVAHLVGQFCAHVEQAMDSLAAGKTTKEQFKSVVYGGLVNELGGIFAGEDERFKPIIGFNGQWRSLGARLRVDLGTFWQDNRAEYDEDPIRAFFGWIVWFIADCRKKADGDDELLEVMLEPQMQQVVLRLMGLEERAR